MHDGPSGGGLEWAPAVRRDEGSLVASDRLGRRQVDMNASSRDQWEGFAEHRQRLTSVLAREKPAGRSRLCVLGAGNANDLDLTALLSTHREVHLVDIDSAALSAGAKRQGVARHPRLHLHGGVDVTAALGVLSDRTPLFELTPAELQAMAEWPASRTAMVLPSGFDHVASTCLLSQILETAANSLGKDHRQLSDAQAALRIGHLRLMARLAARGGEAVLVTDVVSSQILAALPTLPAEALAGLLTRLGRTGNHFRGVHPRQILAALRADPAVGPLIAAVAQLTPWRWRLHSETYLVGAVRFRLAPT
jgi:hypothetical protein